jgi:hypothetical protein
MWSNAYITQVAVSVVGITLMTAAASYSTWSRKLDAPTVAKQLSTATHVSMVAKERQADLGIKENNTWRRRSYL